MKNYNSCNSCPTILKAAKLDTQCYHGLFKLLGGFGNFEDEPNFMKSCFFKRKFVIHITLVQHCQNQSYLAYNVSMASLSFYEVFAIERPTKLCEITLL